MRKDQWIFKVWVQLLQVTSLGWGLHDSPFWKGRDLVEKSGNGCMESVLAIMENDYLHSWKAKNDCKNTYLINNCCSYEMISVLLWLKINQMVLFCLCKMSETQGLFIENKLGKIQWKSVKWGGGGGHFHCFIMENLCKNL